MAPRRLSAAQSLSSTLTLILLTVAATRPGNTIDPIGCYLATPPLGQRPASPALDTALAFFALDSGGTLRRPLLSARDDRTHGNWFVRGDSLFVTFSNGFTGWNYQLTATTKGWTGVAHWITDELGTPSVQRATVWTRVRCR